MTIKGLLEPWLYPQCMRYVYAHAPQTRHERPLVAPDIDYNMAWQAARYVRLAKILYGCQFEVRVFTQRIVVG
jgi:hypothetical protein